jgi:hypothetical protein
MLHCPIVVPAPRGRRNAAGSAWQKAQPRRSNDWHCKAGTSIGGARCRDMETRQKMTDRDQPDKPPLPEATQQRAPERELELKLKKHPDDDNAKVDVGSDESMDASDPVAATAPGGNEPAPSSGFPEEK